MEMATPTLSVVQWAASLGVGGVLAAAMFFVYRKDALAAQAQLAKSTEQVTQLAGRVFDLVDRVGVSLAKLDECIDQWPSRKE